MRRYQRRNKTSLVIFFLFWSAWRKQDVVPDTSPHTSYSILTIAELVEELGDSKKEAIVSGRQENSTTKFFA